MNSVVAGQAASQDALPAVRTKNRLSACADDPQVLADIYQEDINIAIWQRPNSALLDDALKAFLAANPQFQTAVTVSPESAPAQVDAVTGGSLPTELSEDVGELVAMFCDLFELKRAGLRLAALDRAMCPRFHVDRVPCRLVTTYYGVATEWLPHWAINRSKLGPGSNGQPDHVSGLFSDESLIQRLTCGDVALLKGELWAGNDDAGLVHRSPAVPEGDNRLLLSLDFTN